MNEPTVTFEGRTYQLWQGRLLLDWGKRAFSFHTQGCVLCCTARDDKGRHPEVCLNCGPAWDKRRPDPCSECGKTAHFRDDSGRPVHKTCFERIILAALNGEAKAAVA